MKHILPLVLAFLTLPIQAQNWIGKKNYLDIYNKSSVVVAGTISNIKNHEKDSLKFSPLGMPLKSLTLHSVQIIKGNFNNEHIYYKDIFNGCGYAPILVENVVGKQTLIFAEIRNDSIFQIESFNEGSNKIIKSLREFDKLKGKKSSESLTKWLFESLQDDDLFELLNHNISFEEEPLFKILGSIYFSPSQRNKLYDKLETFEEYDFDNEGVISILVKYNDKRLKDILKGYLIKLKHQPYSQVDELMKCIYQMSGKKELEVLIKMFNDTSEGTKRTKVIEDFISKI